MQIIAAIKERVRTKPVHTGICQIPSGHGIEIGEGGKRETGSARVRPPCIIRKYYTHHDRTSREPDRKMTEYSSLALKQSEIGSFYLKFPYHQTSEILNF